MSDSTRSKAAKAIYAALDERFGETISPHGIQQIAALALTAYESHLSAEGMAVVPVEPTTEMRRAGFNADLTEYIGRTPVRKIWKAMLSASPYGKASMQEASAERAARSEQIPPGKEESK